MCPENSLPCTGSAHHMATWNGCTTFHYDMWGTVETNGGVAAVCCLLLSLSPPWPLHHCLSIYRQRRGRPSGPRPRASPPVAQAGPKRPHPTARPARPRLHAARPRAPQRPLRWRPLVRLCSHVAPQWRQPPRGCAPTTPGVAAPTQSTVNGRVGRPNLGPATGNFPTLGKLLRPVGLP